MSQAGIISARGLHKQFGAVYAARDLSLEIAAGTVTGLIGTNGAGKTTFVNMLTGYLKPDRGSIFFEGHEITGKPPRQIARLGISRSFQIPQLFNSLGARENVEIALDVAGRDRGASDEMLARFGLSAYAEANTGTLPEGLRKLLDIALAMVAQPRVLLLDEPTSGVASEEKFDVMDRVMEVTRRTGVTVLFVEHDMEIVRRYSDQVVAFYDGSILAAGEPEAVLNHRQVLEYIVGEEPAAAEKEKQRA